MKNEPSAATTSVKTSEVGISLDHPPLVKTDPEFKRPLLRRFDQYSTTTLALVKQITTDSLSTEVIKPVGLKFCVDPEFLQSSIALGLVSNAVDCEILANHYVCELLDERCKESKETVTLDQLDKLVQNWLRTDMRNSNATTRMQDMFAEYYTFLILNGLNSLTSDSPKVAFEHVFSAIRPLTLHDRLTTDLLFAKYELC